MTNFEYGTLDNTDDTGTGTGPNSPKNKKVHRSRVYVRSVFLNGNCCTVCKYIDNFNI